MPTSFEYTFDFNGERFVAAADRTLWWPAQKALLLADVHAGKAEHFRRAGAALPAGNLAADLERLERAITRTGARRVIVLGDLFHSEVNAEWQQWADWCRRQSCAVELVRGNHDRFLSDADLAAAGMAVHTEPYALGPLQLRHHPPVAAVGGLHISGHIHPVTWLAGPARDRWRLACFWLRDSQIVLPAFGSLTGGFVIGRNERALGCSPDFSLLVTKT